MPVPKLIKNTMEGKNVEGETVQRTGHSTQDGQAGWEVFLDKEGIPRRYSTLNGKELGRANVERYEYELFNFDKASLLCNLLSEGKSLKESLEVSGVSRISYRSWNKNNNGFKRMVDEARNNRAEHVHETLFEKGVIPLMELDFLEDSDGVRILSENLKRVNIAVTPFKEMDGKRFKNEKKPASVDISFSPTTFVMSENDRTTMETECVAVQNEEGLIVTKQETNPPLE